MINGLNQRSDELNNLSENIQTKAQKIKVETDNVSTSQKKLNYVAGKYVAAKEKEGGAIGFAVNSVLNGVSGAFIEPFANYAALGNQYEDLSPEEKQYYKDKGYNKDQIENILDNKAILKAKNDAGVRKRSMFFTLQLLLKIGMFAAKCGQMIIIHIILLQCETRWSNSQSKSRNQTEKHKTTPRQLPQGASRWRCQPSEVRS